MSSEKFCLKWNDFERNISLSFKEIREENDFFDVTLACDDEQIRAHKLILSACSPFFKDVLRKNPHQHPLLYLRGIKFRDIQSILQFMYHGEVNVAQEDLNSFLSISEELKVKGLTQGNQGKHGKSETGSQAVDSQPPPPPRQPGNIKRGGRTNFQSQDDEDDIQDVTPIKTEPSQEVGQGHEVSLGDGFDGGHYQEEDANYDYGQYQEEEGSYSVDATQGNKGSEFQCIEDFDRLIVRDGVEKVCSLCGVFRNKTITNVRCHIEARHFPGLFSYTCDGCQKLCRTKNAFIQHKKMCRHLDAV